MTPNRGRPPVGPRITVRVDSDLLAWLDAQRGAGSRADFIRRLLHEARTRETED